MPIRIFRILAALAAFIIVGAACSPQAPPAAAPAAQARTPAPPSWDDFTAHFLDAYFKLEPFFAVQAGKHEYDGQMPDLSAAGIAREVAWLTKERADTAAFPAAALSPPQRFERDYLLSVIDTNLFWLDRARSPFTNPAWYIDALDPQVYMGRKYAPLAVRMRGYIGYARSIPQIAADIRANLRVPLARSLLERGISGFGGYADFYRHDAPRVFESVADPQAQKDLAAADEAAARAMDGLKVWLEAERPRATDNFALGGPLFAELLKDTDDVDVPVEKILAIGRADLERNIDALRGACAQFLPGRSLTACVDRMRADKPKGGPVHAATEQLKMLKAFIIAKHIVTIPSDNEVVVVEAPPYNRANSAYIETPGPYDKALDSEYNIAPPDPSWSAKEREEYIPGRADLLYTSAHEALPGHFVQFSYSNRNPSRVAALWVSYAYAEGWAHYCEQMMWDEGLGNGDPEGHVGQLENALLRDVRLISAIGLHTGGMTVKESEKLFREEGFQDPGDAEQQAERGTYDPAYLNYTLGKLMIMKLRNDWVAAQVQASGGSDPKAYWPAFHDRFLSYGGPPIPLVRQAMLGAAGSLL